ncbi:PAAR-like protein [Brevibacillus porteri]|uniref:PAAR-like protein n=1 Tax=Brevibacillus porteri TaxID=2126350 RepID=UPI003D1C1088
MPNIEDINIQQSSAERKSYVVVGAILSCSSGSKQSRLKMPFSHGVFVKGKPQVSIMDFVPNINIMPFGKCISLKNPAVASATAANNGVLTPMPCTPLTTMPWMDGKADKMVGGHPALLNKSTNMCFHCGLIKIEDDGQDLAGVTIGNQSSANSGPSAAGFGQGPACEKPQEKPSMWDNFVKGISMLGDVPAAMQKAASELPGALEKAANDLPKGLQKAAEDFPKGVGVFVREGYIEPMQEDVDTLRDEDINLEDALAISGLAVHALTLGRSKNVKDLVNALKKGKKGTGQGLKVPQGLTQAQFDKVSSMIREKVGHISEDIVVQGSRAKGTAKPTSDIDIAIRVPTEKFDELIQNSFSKVKPPNSGSAKEKTMLHAIETGKIQSGEAKLSKFREQLQQELGMDVDISIIKIGGPFDNPPFTPLK